MTHCESLHLNLYRRLKCKKGREESANLQIQHCHSTTPTYNIRHTQYIQQSLSLKKYHLHINYSNILFSSPCSGNTKWERLLSPARHFAVGLKNISQYVRRRKIYTDSNRYTFSGKCGCGPVIDVRQLQQECHNSSPMNAKIQVHLYMRITDFVRYICMVS